MNKDFSEHYSSVGVQKETDPYDLTLSERRCFHGAL